MKNILVLYAIFTFLLYVSAAIGVGVQSVAGSYGVEVFGALAVLSSVVAVALLIALGMAGE